MHDVRQYLPSRINSGPFLTSYTLPELEARIRHDKILLPICSLGTPVEQLRAWGRLFCLRYIMRH